MQFFNRPNNNENASSVIQDKIIELIRDSEKSLKIAVAWFTNHDIFNEILNKLQNQNFVVQLIVLNDRINNKNQGLDFQKLINKGGVFYYSSIENMVHHKFCIIDETIVVTGSYNWTYPAEVKNWENVFVVREMESVREYINEFEYLVKFHEEVKIINEVKNQIGDTNSSEYIQADYLIQADREIARGKNLHAAKIFTEVLKVDNTRNDIVQKRNTIIQSYNSKTFEISPFEIGLVFQRGYFLVIPAFCRLPYKKIVDGNSTVNEQHSAEIIVQKRDVNNTNILSFVIDGLMPRGMDERLINVELSFDKTGMLTVLCSEADGGNRISKTQKVNIKYFLT